MFRVPGWKNLSSLALRFALFGAVAVCASLFGGPAAWAGVIHHVRADAAGADNGQSWADAYTDLQAALAAAAPGDEIWVAEGTYKPTSGTDRAASFVLKSGVGIYGGFAGAETERDQRDWEIHATILSGDIGQADDSTDNSYHVVIGANLAVLDGFTIARGNANVTMGTFDRGGGMYNLDCSPDVTNCTFVNNTAGNYDEGTGSGGAMYNENSSPGVTNCTFRWNGVIEGKGGGMYNSDSSPDVTGCAFSENAVGGGPGHSGDIWSGAGAGMFNSGGSPTVTNCTFSSNTAIGMFGSGAGVCNSHSSPTVTGCAFSGNTACFGGGMDSYSGSPDVTNCAFSGNTVGYGNGGGMCNEDASSPTVTNSIFWDNSAPLCAEIYTASPATPTFSHCDIKNCGESGASWDAALGADGGGNIMSDPRFVAPAAPAGPDGLWRTRDDGLRLRSDSLCIGAADPAVAPPKDILGLPRKTAPDIGAYEFYPMNPASADPAWLLFR